MASKPLKPHQTALVAAGLASLIIWAIPVVGQFMLPLQYLNTHLHELCHAIMALAVGGQVQQIVVRADGSGVTPVFTPGGFAPLLVASAGYVGASLVGAAMIFFGRSPKGATTVLYTLSVVLALSMALWVRHDLVGVFSGIFWVGALCAGARFLQGNAILFATQFLGLQQCLAAIQSLYVLLKISAFGEGQSDAGILQAQTGVPAMVWAVGWCLFSLVMVGLTMRKAWDRPTARGAGRASGPNSPRGPRATR